MFNPDKLYTWERQTASLAAMSHKNYQNKLQKLVLPNHTSFVAHVPTAFS